jgi:hypothetical protein
MIVTHDNVVLPILARDLKEISDESSPFFFRIKYAVKAYDPYFVQRRDACEFLKSSSFQKIVASMRILEREASADFTNEYL